MYAAHFWLEISHMWYIKNNSKKKVLQPKDADDFNKNNVFLFVFN